MHCLTGYLLTGALGWHRSPYCLLAQLSTIMTIMAHTDTIYIQDLKAHGIIGTLPHEKTDPQELIINAAIQIDIRLPAQSDQLSDAVDYSKIYTRIITMVQDNQSELIESLINQIALSLFQHFPIHQLTIRIDKPQALTHCRSVGIEIQRHYSDYPHSQLSNPTNTLHTHIPATPTLI